MSDSHTACRATEQKLREANRRLQAQGAELERDKLIIQLRARIASLEEQVEDLRQDCQTLRDSRDRWRDG